MCYGSNAKIALYIQPIQLPMYYPTPIAAGRLAALTRPLLEAGIGLLVVMGSVCTPMTTWCEAQGVLLVPHLAQQELEALCRC